MPPVRRADVTAPKVGPLIRTKKRFIITRKRAPIRAEPAATRGGAGLPPALRRASFVIARR